ncbi:MAG: SAM-dependent methyltransferase, partial [Nitriliruptor sp.]|uniref:SAM-dependent methyltransferase n=1 Tax=Nitriliruptor sp. TaxID=2448056 RepID=UPI0034A0929D
MMAASDEGRAGSLLGVGVGPGDPELITVKGRDALLAADAIFVPVSATSPPDEPGYAERVVLAHVPHATPITRLPFELGEDAREDSWRAAAAAVAEVVGDGRTAAFATIGDPNVYST